MNLVQADFSHSAFRRGGNVPDQVGKQRVPADVVDHPAQGPARSARSQAASDRTGVRSSGRYLSDPLKTGQQPVFPDSDRSFRIS